MPDLTTFHLPGSVTGSRADVELGHDMIDAWRADGIFQIATGPHQRRMTGLALEASRRFFAMPPSYKARHVSELTYSGYIASGEEVTAGRADQSEIFTVCPDIPMHDHRVRDRWPCHGPVPWPDAFYRLSMQTFMRELAAIGDGLLKLAALGLDLPAIDGLSRTAAGGWHHMRVLRFPAGSAGTSRGIGAHTDYGMLVLAAQDEVGGLYVRPPVPGEHRGRNWLDAESTAGMYEDEEPWTYVRPVPDVLTCFPGDIMQFLTGGFLLSTPHKVALAGRERYALAYFHEPGFTSSLRPLAHPAEDERIHYGTHFTNMFMRCYPDRPTTRRIHTDDRLSVLARIRSGSAVLARTE